MKSLEITKLESKLTSNSHITSVIQSNETEHKEQASLEKSDIGVQTNPIELLENEIEIRQELDNLIMEEFKDDIKFELPRREKEEKFEPPRRDEENDEESSEENVGFKLSYPKLKLLTHQMTPSCIDGLNSIERKILYYAFKLNGAEVKLKRLTASVLVHFNDKADQNYIPVAIVGLAQNFVGTNNINLLLPIGNFGTRKGMDTDYLENLSISLSPVTRFIFPQEDDILYNQTISNSDLERMFYVPVIPLVLINGFSQNGNKIKSQIPKFHPLDIIKAYRKRMEGILFTEQTFVPWYKGFRGECQLANNSKSYFCIGVVEKLSDHGVAHISEIPPMISIKEYKEVIEKRMRWNHNFITHIEIGHKKDIVEFKLKIIDLDTLFQSKLIEKLLLKIAVPFEDFILQNKYNEKISYPRIADIMEEHYNLREECYQKRKALQVSRLTRECKTLENICRFVKEDLHLFQDQESKGIMSILSERGYTKESELNRIFKEMPQESKILHSPQTEYDYLINCKSDLYSQEVEKLYSDKLGELCKVDEQDAIPLWEQDLKALELAIVGRWKDEENAYKKEGKGLKNVESSIIIDKDSINQAPPVPHRLKHQKKERSPVPIVDSKRMKFS